MKCTMERQLGDWIQPYFAARKFALFICALGMCAVSARQVVGQASNLHAAFEDVDTSNTRAREPWLGAVRLAAAPQKPATPPPVRKPAPKKASPPHTASAETQSPIIMEELPPGPMKAVLPLAGAAPAAGLKLLQGDKEKGLITLILRDKPLSQVLALLAQTQQLNIVAANDIEVMISITLRRVPVEDALTA